jgi:hypothetical protein
VMLEMMLGSAMRSISRFILIVCCFCIRFSWTNIMKMLFPKVGSVADYDFS